MQSSTREHDWLFVQAMGLRCAFIISQVLRLCEGYGVELLSLEKHVDILYRSVRRRFVWLAWTIPGTRGNFEYLTGVV